MKKTPCDKKLNFIKILYKTNYIKSKNLIKFIIDIFNRVSYIKIIYLIYCTQDDNLQITCTQYEIINIHISQKGLGQIECPSSI